MKLIQSIAAFTLGATIMTHAAIAAARTPPPTLGSIPRSGLFSPNSTRTAAPSGSCLNQSRRRFSTELQSQTAVDMSGVATTERTISQDGRSVKLYVMKPAQVSSNPGVLFFIHGGVWLVGNFQNHQRLLRDLVVGSGQIGVFVEYTPLPQANFRPSSRKAMRP